MARSRATCPILMYRKVGEPPTGGQDSGVNVSAEGFRRQMRLMLSLGYRAQTFADVSEALSRD